jgi:hypothetical protein
MRYAALDAARWRVAPGETSIARGSARGGSDNRSPGRRCEATRAPDYGASGALARSNRSTGRRAMGAGASTPHARRRALRALRSRAGQAPRPQYRVASRLAGGAHGQAHTDCTRKGGAARRVHAGRAPVRHEVHCIPRRQVPHSIPALSLSAATCSAARRHVCFAASNPPHDGTAPLPSATRIVVEHNSISSPKVNTKNRASAFFSSIQLKTRLASRKGGSRLQPHRPTDLCEYPSRKGEGTRWPAHRSIASSSLPIATKLRGASQAPPSIRHSLRASWRGRGCARRGRCGRGRPCDRGWRARPLPAPPRRPARSPPTGRSPQGSA